MIDRPRLLCGIALSLAALSWLMLAAAAGLPARELELFAAGSVGSLPSAILPLLAAISSTFVVLFVPGLAVIAGLRRLRPSGAIKRSFSFVTLNEHLLASFLLSIGIWVCSALLLGGIPDALDLRNGPILLGSLLAGGVCIFTSRVGRGRETAGQKDLDGRAAVLALVLISVALVAFREYLSFNVLNDDEIEAANFALSLGEHSLPYWDLEDGLWGFYPNFMAFAYPLHVLTRALGASEFAFRMLYFVSLFVAICGSCSILEHLLGRRARWVEIGLVCAAAGLATVVALFYSSWHPFLAGPAEPSGTDMFGFALFAGALVSYCRGRNGWFLAFAWAHCAALPNGIAYVVTWLTLTFLIMSQERRRVTRLTMIYLAGAAVYGLAYAMRGGASLFAGSQFGLTDIASRYLTSASTPNDILGFLGLVVVLSGGGLVLLLGLLWQRPRHGLLVAVAFVTLHTLTGALFYRLQHPHYHLPIMLLVSVVVLSVVADSGVTFRRWAHAGLAMAYVLSVMLLLPRSIPLVDNTRRLGALTEIACGDGDLRTLYRDANGLVSAEEVSGSVSWLTHGIDRSQWLFYGLTATKQGAPQVIIMDARAEAPTGFRRIGGGVTCQVVLGARFDPDAYLPRHGYRDEAAWSMLALRGWREHFQR